MNIIYITNHLDERYNFSKSRNINGFHDINGTIKAISTYKQVTEALSIDKEFHDPKSYISSQLVSKKINLDYISVANYFKIVECYYQINWNSSLSH